MSQPSNNGLYIMLISIHGLIRGHNMELGRDSDTGGQTKYVVELAKALGSHPDVSRVDLITRQIFDKKVDADYCVADERLSSNVRCWVKTALETLLHAIEQAEDNVGLAVATGWRIESTLAVLEKWKAPVPGVLITVVGTEIY